MSQKREPTPNPEDINKKEMQEAQDFFALNPTALKYSRKLSGLNSSYLRSPEGNIIRLANKNEANHVLGDGGLGRAKKAQIDTDGGMMAVKVQRIDHEESLKEAMREARITYDLGVATTELAVRDLGDTRMKVYQGMHNLGQSLSKVTAEPLSDNQRLDLSINLLLQVHSLHNGNASQTHTAYAHRDIKPGNVLVQEDNKGNYQVRLIDFGTATEDITNTDKKFTGTDPYLPIDLADLSRLAAMRDGPRMDETAVLEKEKKSNALQDDRIAALRTIYYPDNTITELNSIMPIDMFQQLPKHIQVLLDTTTIAPLLTVEREKETELFLAAALISYKDNAATTTPEFVTNLRDNIKLQKTIIETYQKTHPASINQNVSTSAKKTPDISKPFEGAPEGTDADELKAEQKLLMAEFIAKNLHPELSQDQISAMCADVTSQDRLLAFKKSLAPGELLQIKATLPNQEENKKLLLINHIQHTLKKCLKDIDLNSKTDKLVDKMIDIATDANLSVEERAEMLSVNLEICKTISVNPIFQTMHAQLNSQSSSSTKNAEPSTNTLGRVQSNTQSTAQETDTPSKFKKFKNLFTKSRSENSETTVEKRSSETNDNRHKMN